MAVANPFIMLGTQLEAGLNAVINDILGDPPVPDPEPGFDEIVQYTVAYVSSVYITDPDPVKELELSTVVSDAVNGYLYSKSGGYLTGYNSRQEFFMYQLLDGLRQNVPVYGIRRYIEEVENNMAESGLSTAEQAPLLMATTLGKASFDYWSSDEAQTLWDPFLSLMDASGPTTMLWLVPAAMEAALLTAKRNQHSSVVDTSSNIGADAVSVLTAGIGLSSSFVVFQLLKAPKKPGSVGKHPHNTGTPTNAGLPAGVPAPPVELFKDSNGSGCGC